MIRRYYDESQEVAFENLSPLEYLAYATYFDYLFDDFKVDCTVEKFKDYYNKYHHMFELRYGNSNKKYLLLMNDDDTILFGMELGETKIITPYDLYFEGFIAKSEVNSYIDRLVQRYMNILKTNLDVYNREIYGEEESEDFSEEE